MSFFYGSLILGRLGNCQIGKLGNWLQIEVAEEIGGTKSEGNLSFVEDVDLKKFQNFPIPAHNQTKFLMKFWAGNKISQLKLSSLLTCGIRGLFFLFLKRINVLY